MGNEHPGTTAAYAFHQLLSSCTRSPLHTRAPTATFALSTCNLHLSQIRQEQPPAATALQEPRPPEDQDQFQKLASRTPKERGVAVRKVSSVSNPLSPA